MCFPLKKHKKILPILSLNGFEKFHFTYIRIFFFKKKKNQNGIY